MTWIDDALLVAIGFALGTPFGSWLDRALWPRQVAEAEEEFTPSMAWNLEALPLIPAFPVGVGRKAEKWVPDERLRGLLAIGLFKLYGEKLPPEDVWIKARWLQGRLKSRADADKMREYIGATPKMGYRNETGEVYLRRHRAREIVCHAIRLKRITFG